MDCELKSDDVPIKIIQYPIDERMETLSYVFLEEYDQLPTFYVRVPGRVNIIGEHIDYCGYPVLPMALKQDILIAAAVTDDRILRIRNVNKNYPDCDTQLISYERMNISQILDMKPPWYNYVMSGVKGSLKFLKSKFDHGLQLYVDGNIPPESGLSSSSALVTASCLAFLYGHNAKLNKSEIASLCADSEVYIGTQGGGMDQAIALLAEKYSAQYITFDPLTATPVALPQDAAFVVANSLVDHNKAASSDFNHRVVECRLAAQVIAKREGINTNNKLIRFSILQKRLGKTLDEMICLIHKHLTENSYTKQDLCNILDISEEDLDWEFLTNNTTFLKQFKLKQRALHVYEEATRVELFKQICENPDASTNILKELGQLISGSHESLKNLYECSHENLDLMVNISKEMDVCARLTGAGWGGSIVAICHQNDADKYIELLTEKYYIGHCKLKREDVSAYIFSTIPNDGATIYKCSNSY